MPDPRVPFAWHPPPSRAGGVPLCSSSERRELPLFLLAGRASDHSLRAEGGARHRTGWSASWARAGEQAGLCAGVDGCFLGLGAAAPCLVLPGPRKSRCWRDRTTERASGSNSYEQRRRPDGYAHLHRKQRPSAQAAQPKARQAASRHGHRQQPSTSSCPQPTRNGTEASQGGNQAAKQPCS